MDAVEREWQDTDTILADFEKRRKVARIKYEDFYGRDGPGKAAEGKFSLHGFQGARFMLFIFEWSCRSPGNRSRKGSPQPKFVVLPLPVKNRRDKIS
jgi:hypothetical protein